MKPSAASCIRASRTGVIDTPNLTASGSGYSRSPAANSPLMMRPTRRFLTVSPSVFPRVSSSRGRAVDVIVLPLSEVCNRREDPYLVLLRVQDGRRQPTCHPEVRSAPGQAYRGADSAGGSLHMRR